MIPCPSCGAVNRVPREQIDRGRLPVCGRCKAPLPAGGGAPVILTDATFTTEVSRSSVPVLVDMWAPWCGPCRTMAPMVEALALELAGKVLVAKLNVDENPVTAEQFNVRGIPSLLIFKGGREVDRIVGVQPKSEIARRLQTAIG